MSDRAALTTLQLREPANLVCRRAIWYWTTRALLFWLVILAVEIAIYTQTGGSRTPVVVVIAVSAVLGLLHVLVMPQWRYRVHRWEATDHAVYTRSGWFNQSRRIAPLSRIQTVDTERGPLEQLFRLANVTVTTASAAGPLRIHGLAPAEADRLVAELTLRTSATAGDAT
ncbi:MAG TPA: PH domain-containing protein [Jatrophihabitans sp.]|nr:PH domain-containing protein [Jatrophihabitans sp.]